ncbi:MAG: hypothetical protein N4A47_01100 [Clostridia bacterium]|jgi:hypothetical protein|nr:hypothetical protein [Clostridia bacterium]
MNRDVRFGITTIKKILKIEYGDKIITRMHKEKVYEMFDKFLRDKGFYISENVTDLSSLIEFVSSANPSAINEIAGHKNISRMISVYTSFQNNTGGFLPEEAEVVRKNIGLNDKIEGTFVVKELDLETIVKRATKQGCMTIVRNYGDSIENDIVVKRMLLKKLVRYNSDIEYDDASGKYLYIDDKRLRSRYSQISFGKNFYKVLEDARVDKFNETVDSHVDEYNGTYEMFGLDKTKIKDIIHNFDRNKNTNEINALKHVVDDEEKFEMPYIMKEKLEELYGQKIKDKFNKDKAVDMFKEIEEEGELE